MSRTLLVLGVSIMILCTFSNTSIAKKFEEDQVETLRADISSLNLINGLYLNSQQLNQYLYILKEFNQLKLRVKNESSLSLNKTINNFTKLKNELAYNNGASKQTSQEAAQINDYLKSQQENYREKYYQLEQKMMSILSDNQKSIASNFKPCLIPPKSLRDPSKVGQAKDNDKGVKILQKIRSFPQNIYLSNRDKFFEDRYLNKYEKKIKELTPEEEKTEKIRVFKIFDSVRSLSDVDFELKVNDMADQLIPEVPRKKHEVSIAGRVLLNTNMIPIIEKRIRTSK